MLYNVEAFIRFHFLHRTRMAIASVELLCCRDRSGLIVAARSPLTRRRLSAAARSGGSAPAWADGGAGAEVDLLCQSARHDMGAPDLADASKVVLRPRDGTRLNALPIVQEVQRVWPTSLRAITEAPISDSRMLSQPIEHHA